MSYRGIIQKGDRRGESLGFPTANISISDESVSGIYAARAVIDEKEYHAAAYIDTARKLLKCIWAHILEAICMEKRWR